MFLDDQLIVERARIWARVYADTMNNGMLNDRASRSPDAVAAADQALVDFNLMLMKVKD